jgi:hypothetical protein
MPFATRRVMSAAVLAAAFCLVALAWAEEQKVELVGNSVCPVSGKPVAGKPDNPTFYSDFRGYRLGFMCPVCKAAFDSATDAQKLTYLNQALESVGKKIIP